MAKQINVRELVNGDEPFTTGSLRGKIAMVEGVEMEDVPARPVNEAVMRLIAGGQADVVSMPAEVEYFLLGMDPATYCGDENKLESQAESIKDDLERVGIAVRGLKLRG